MKRRRHKAPKSITTLRHLCWGLVITCGLGLTSAPSWAQETATTASPDAIVKIKVQGLRRVQQNTALLGLESKLGTPLNDATITADLRRLWAKGFFRDIAIFKEPAEDGGWVLIIQLDEKPAIRKVELLGHDDLSEDDIKEVVDLKPFKILNLEHVKQNVQKIKDLYLDKGFYLANISYRIEPVKDDPTSVDVVLDITEKAKVTVRQLSIIGNNALSDEEIKGVLQTREGNELSFITSSGTFKEEYFQTDLMRIQALYYDHGYVGITVGQPTTEISPDLRHIYITVPLVEGLQYRVGNIAYSGDVELKRDLDDLVLVSETTLRSRMQTTKDEIFKRSVLFEDIQRLTDVYRNYGYAYANVTPNSKINPETQTVDLDLVVERGNLVYINRIDIVGNTRTRDKVIRRELRLFEGELYSELGIRASKARVFQLGFFETVDIRTSGGSEPDTMNVIVEVTEKSTGTFQVGAGFSSIESFIATAQISQNNFLGKGQTLSLSAQLSFGDFARQMATLQFYEPYFLDSFWSLGLNAYVTQNYYRDFERRSTGISPSLGYPITPDLRLTLGYTLEQIEISTGALGTSGGVALYNLLRDGRSSSITGTLTYDTRNNRLFPTQGQYYLLSAEVSNKALGSEEDMQFNRTRAILRYYHPVVWSLVLKMNAELGYVFGGGIKGVPVSERFFPGGIYSVRGYEPRALGPSLNTLTANDPTSSSSPFVEGGTKQAIFNLELEFTILEGAGIKGVVFMDAGNAFNDGENLFYAGMTESDKPDVYLLSSVDPTKPPLGLYWSFGFGFRWFSPIGPLRFEWGVPITKKMPSDDDILFEFTIGNFF